MYVHFWSDIIEGKNPLLDVNYDNADERLSAMNEWLETHDLNADMIFNAIFPFINAIKSNELDSAFPVSGIISSSPFRNWKTK